MEAETHIHSSSSIGALQISQATYGDDEENAVEANYMSSPEHNNIRGDPAADERELSPPKQGDDEIDTTSRKKEASLSSPAATIDNPGEEMKQQNLPSSSKNTEQTHRNINSYYGHKIGFYQTLSLILNAGLMLYAHLGLSAVIYSSRDPSITSLLDDSTAINENENSNNAGGADANNNMTAGNNSTPSDTTNTTKTTMCNEQDVKLWIQSGGQSTRPKHSNYCSRTYTDSSNKLCLVTPSCISECFQSTYGYSELCSNCFATIPTCSMRNMCTFICAANSFSVECQECNMPCVEEFHLCSGLPKGVVVEEVAEESSGGSGGTNEESSVGDTNAAAVPPSSSSITQQNVDTCNRYDLYAINEWYTAYELTFVRSIKDAWNGDAQVLAVIIVLFSGIWPYAKNIILVIVWYTPMSRKRQSEIILWLSRLSKYTLVDVFAVIGVLVGVQLQLNVGGTDAVIRAEPRFGIIAFFVATLWEFLQIELIKVMYEKKVGGGTNSSNRGHNEGRHSNEGDEREGGRLLFKQLWIPIFIYIASLALYISGAVTELLFFENSDIGSPGVCLRSFNLATLGNALVSPSSLTDNSAAGQTWVLYLVYVCLCLAFPVLTHLLQVVFIIGWGRSMKLKRMIKWTSAIWCFACIEVLLIGVFAVEFKFPQLVGKLAGDTNAGFLEVNSGLGSGFYILIAYSVVAGFLQYSLIPFVDI